MDINEKITEIKLHIKNLVSHFPYTEEEINYLVIAYIALIMLDESISDLIDEVLTKVYCLFTNLTVEEAYNIYFKYANKYKDIHGLYNGYFYDEKGALIYEPCIIIGSFKRISPLERFGTLLHELKHGINEIIIKESSKGFNSGLSLITKDNKNHYDNFDEAFNSFLTKIYLENIQYLKSLDIKDEEIRKILATFNLSKKYFYSYEEYVLPLESLFKSRKLFWALYNASIYKNMDELYQSLESSFDNFISAKKIIKIFSYQSQNINDLLSSIDYSVIEEEFSLPKR